MESGATASASITGISPNQTLNLVLPKGDKGDTGDDGPANTLSIGTVASGDTPAATITGEAPEQVLNLVLPRGEKGDPGEAGASEWGQINGTLSNQTDLQNALDAKLDSSDLSDYVQFTDYASDSTSGVIKAGNGLGVLTNSGYIYGKAYTYAQYQTMPTTNIISKATLDNYVSGKGLITNQVSDLANYYDKTYIDNTVGNIEDILETLDIGSGV